MKCYFRAFKKFATIKGRASRCEYWGFIVVNAIISYILAILKQLPHLMHPGMMKSLFLLGTALAFLVYIVVMLIPAFTTIIRRMHDVGKSGWWSLVPIYGIYLCFINGDIGENKYGARNV